MDANQRRQLDIDQRRQQAMYAAEMSLNKPIIRNIIIGAFELICLLIVVIPTLIAILVAIITLVNNSWVVFFAYLGIAIMTFLSTAFISGAALTLLDIDHNTRTLVRIASDMHRMQSPEVDTHK